MTRHVPSAEMTLGPFFPREFAQGSNNLINEIPKGDFVEITGRVTQADGKPLDNAVLEIWQANPAGRFDDPAFLGWGRAATGADGVYSFCTLMPGALEGRAPHVNFLILFSGLMRQLQTVMFFDGESANAADPVLLAVPAARRSLLVARRAAEGRFVFDIRTRGDGETPFFDD